LFGETDAYYGTVEQQGRLTLHMHMLIWIKHALSPQELRDRLLDDDGEFQKAMVAYLESCHVGEFLTGTMDEVKTKVPYLPQSRKGLHDIMPDAPEIQIPLRYEDPTQTLPTPPPPLCDEGQCEADCGVCEELNEWWVNQKETVDDLILRSNVHTCRKPVPGTDHSKPHRQGARMRAEVRGCLRKDGTCSARFPRDIVPTTSVDPDDGSITMKK
ncbi:hypothetical protein R3P38DRAFT_2485560, partial [Favolaschia claudopus]